MNSLVILQFIQHVPWRFTSVKLASWKHMTDYNSSRDSLKLNGSICGLSLGSAPFRVRQKWKVAYQKNRVGSTTSPPMRL